jgi:hypothetical protein
LEDEFLYHAFTIDPQWKVDSRLARLLLDLRHPQKKDVPTSHAALGAFNDSMLEDLSAVLKPLQGLELDYRVALAYTRLRHALSKCEAFKFLLSPLLSGAGRKSVAFGLLLTRFPLKGPRLQGLLRQATPVTKLARWWHIQSLLEGRGSFLDSQF